MTFANTSNGSAFRAPSAWIPFVLAGAAIALLAGYLATGPHAPNIMVENGIPREDETAAARLWQLLMLMQVPAVAVFAARWLPKDPKRTLAVLALQVAACAAAALPVFLLER
jgi:hypothetical protein